LPLEECFANRGLKTDFKRRYATIVLRCEKIFRQIFYAIFQKSRKMGCKNGLKTALSRGTFFGHLENCHRKDGK